MEARRRSNNRELAGALRQKYGQETSSSSPASASPSYGWVFNWQGRLVTRERVNELLGTSLNNSIDYSTFCDPTGGWLWTPFEGREIFLQPDVILEAIT